MLSCSQGLFAARGPVPVGPGLAMWRFRPLARRSILTNPRGIVHLRPPRPVQAVGPFGRVSGRFFSVEIKVEDFGGESITEGTIMEWQKKVGDFCAKDEILALIETDKVTIEVKAPENGVLEKILAEAEATVEKNQLLATFTPGGEPPKSAAAPAA
ncbi:Dihydrolipoyllysine-residue succinyltransferase component of 2-oxoglutarate dehydrogenase complex, partial [Durusdinium trenchii]